MTAKSRDKLAENIMHFGRFLREAGLNAGPAAVLDAIDAAQLGGMAEPHDFYWTLSSIFVKSHEQAELFDQAFHIFWQKPKLIEQFMKLMLQQIARNVSAAPKPPAHRRLADALFEQPELPKPSRQEQPGSLELDATFTASADEVLRSKDFEQMTVAEQREAKLAIQRLKLSSRAIKTRRFEPAPHGHKLHLRLSLQKALRHGGLMLPSYRRHKTRRPPLVVMCDVSGSCASYSRMFLHLLHGLSNEERRVSVFLFGTRLTHISRQLKGRDVDLAVSRVAETVKDWAGGTRIGTILNEFNRVWGRRVLGQKAELLLMTDGLERGNIAELNREMKRLRLSCRHIIWANPLLRWDGFAPQALGIKTILPLVDEFRPVHNVTALSQLAQALSREGGDQKLKTVQAWMKG